MHSVNKNHYKVEEEYFHASTHYWAVRVYILVQGYVHTRYIIAHLLPSSMCH